jgi:glucans biosynthesis protein C
MVDSLVSSKNNKAQRKYYIDNIRWIIIVLVFVQHVIYMFNTVGVIGNFVAPGIPYMDTYSYFVYPWFMACLFVVAGMSAKYSMEKRNLKKIVVERVKKLLIPFLSGMVLFSPIISYYMFTNLGIYEKTFKAVPSFVVYIILCSIGMAQLWFLLEMFVFSMILLLIRKIDKNNKLYKLGGKANLIFILLCVIPAYFFAQYLNFLSVFRNLLYFFLFILGYSVFSHEHIQNKVKKYGLIFLLIGIFLGIIQTYMLFGQDYSSCCNNWLAIIFTWFMILGIIGCGQKWLDFSNKFTKYMTNNSFAFYMFHYLPMLFIAGFVTKTLGLPIIVNYILVFILSAIVTVLMAEIIKRIPVVRTLFGINNIN